MTEAATTNTKKTWNFSTCENSHKLADKMVKQIIEKYEVDFNDINDNRFNTQAPNSKLISLMLLYVEKNFDKFIKDMNIQNYWTSHFTPKMKKLLKQKKGWDLDE